MWKKEVQFSSKINRNILMLKRFFFFLIFYIWIRNPKLDFQPGLWTKSARPRMVLISINSCELISLDLN